MKPVFFPRVNTGRRPLKLIAMIEPMLDRKEYVVLICHSQTLSRNEAVRVLNARGKGFVPQSTEVMIAGAADRTQDGRGMQIKSCNDLLALLPLSFMPTNSQPSGCAAFGAMLNSQVTGLVDFCGQKERA